MKTISKTLLDLLHADHNAGGLAVLMDFWFPDDSHLRYARWSSNLTYGGNVYTAWPFDAEILTAGKGTSVPTTTLSIDDSAQVLRPHALESAWFYDTWLTVTIVCPAQLGVDSSWSSVTSKILKAEPRGDVIGLTLGGDNIAQMRFPPERYWFDQCPYARGFKADPRCGYSGAETDCDGSLADCVARSNEERFGGFLGLDPEAARIVLPFSIRGI